jgi:hypothetical protein
VLHAVAHFFGFDAGQGNGSHYLFWSGAGSDLAYIGILWALVRSRNCHQPKCWRIGHLPVQGTSYRVCRRHHPDPPGRETIRQRYHLYAGKRPGRG